jgi:hypothetical protein
MDTNSAHSDDLNKLERQLAAWQPAPAGLDADAMLFAAGRASVRTGKAWSVWPIVSGCLALAVAVLGIGLTAERSERLALLAQLQQRPPQAAPGISETPAPEPLPPDAYLVLLREWEQRPGDWMSWPHTPREAPKHPAATEPPILRAWPPDPL